MMLLCRMQDEVTFLASKLVGARESRKRAEKKIGVKNSRTKRGAPGDTVLPDQFQTDGVVLTFSGSNQRAARLRVVSCVLHGKIQECPVARHVYLGRSPKFYSRRKVPIAASNGGEIVPTYPQKDLTENTLNLRRYHYSSRRRLQHLTHSLILTLMSGKFSLMPSKFSLHELGRYAVRLSLHTKIKLRNSGNAIAHDFLSLVGNSISSSEYFLVFSEVLYK